MSDNLFVVHELFFGQYVEFLANFSHLESALTTQLRRSHEHPTSGRAMHDIAPSALRGRVYRLKIGGRQGHPYVYLLGGSKEHQGVVLPVWLSMKPRPRIDYQKEPFQELAEAIMGDFEAGATERFAIWEHP